MRNFVKSTLAFLRLWQIALMIINLKNYRKEKQLKDKKFNDKLLAASLESTYGDQKGQVQFLLNNFFDYEKNGLKKDGFFVDLAAADGVTGSNTLFLEKYLGWKGILFEPNPNYKKLIESHRTSPLVTDCVTDKAGELVKFRIDNGQLGGIVGDDFDNRLEVRGRQLKSAQIIDVPTTTLQSELDKFSAPKIIDFLSLDVEGAEYLVLKNFPFDKYKFKMATIERPNVELDLLLDANGYIQIRHLHYDVVYAHSDFLDQVNLEPKHCFAFTPRKKW